MHLSAHAFQVTEMCELFGGRKLQLAYTAALVFYTFFALWGYGAVFGDAMSTYAPVPFLGEVGAYSMYVLLFAFVVVPLSTMEIKEQAAFQVHRKNRVVGGRWTIELPKLGFKYFGSIHPSFGLLKIYR